MKKRVTIVLFLLVCGLLAARSVAFWSAMKFDSFGYKFLVKDGGKKVWFYKASSEKPLTLETTFTRPLQIRVIVKDNAEELKYKLLIDGTTQNYTVKKERIAGKAKLMNNSVVNLDKAASTEEWGQINIMSANIVNLAPGKHKLQIVTENKNAYFRIFTQKYRVVKTVIKPLLPKKYQRILSLVGEKQASTYYTADSKNPLEAEMVGPGNLYIYSRAFKAAVVNYGYDVLIDGKLQKSEELKAKFTKKYTLKEDQFQRLTTGHKAKFAIPAGKHKVTLQPKSDTVYLFKLLYPVAVSK